jgi:hypothetical protein
MLIGTSGSAFAGVCTFSGNGIWSNAALWSPGEVRVTPEQTYYLRVQLHDGGTFQLYRFPERYPLGDCWRDGVNDDGWDLESQILGASDPISITVTSPPLLPGWHMISLPLRLTGLQNLKMTPR